MKKLLIVSNNLHIGGVQKALVNLLWAVRGQYDVTLLLFYRGGAYLGQLPPEVKVMEPSSHYRFLGMTGRDARTFADKLGRAFYAGITRLFGRSCALGLMGLGQKRLTGFDAAISYLHDASDKAFYGGCNDFVLRHTDAPTKITFLHCDFCKCGGNTPKNRERYRRFDAIAACSRGCADSFLAANPELASRVRVVYNCHRTESLEQLALEAPVELPRDRINVVTVARLGAEKAVPRAVEAMARLKEAELPFHYYIIGDGAQRTQTEQAVSGFALEKEVTLLGQMENPFGYIQAADLLLIPSVSEAAPMVIGEAVRLGTPVLSTRTSSARELILEPDVGWVCENSTRGIADALEELLGDPDRLARKRQQIARAGPDNRAALEQLRQLLQSR